MEKGIYKYFISFSHMTDNSIGFGSTIVDSNVKITDFKSTGEMQKWINDLQKSIEKKNGYITNVIVLNFILLN